MPSGEHGDRCVGQAELEICVPVDESHSCDDVVWAELGKCISSIGHVFENLALHPLAKTL